MTAEKTIPFTPEAALTWLDGKIAYWQHWDAPLHIYTERDAQIVRAAYIDAYQSIRKFILKMAFPKESEGETPDVPNESTAGV